MQNAIVNYHIQSTERQAFQFDVGGVFGHIVSPELTPTLIGVQDIRGHEDTMRFASDGIQFEKHASSINDFMESSSDWETTYNQELQTLLTDKLGAKEVIVFDHTLRVDDPDAPRQPARNVHNDYSQRGAEERLIDIVGEERAREFQQGHYGFVNVWRPVEGPILSSPLGFIRPASMAAEDWMVIDLVYPDEVREILGAAANENHEWFYLSGMTPQEVAIFNVYDNQGLPYLGHSALDMESHNTGLPPRTRKSIESRTIVRY